MRQVGDGSPDLDAHDLSVKILFTTLPIRVDVQLFRSVGETEK